MVQRGRRGPDASLTGLAVSRGLGSPARGFVLGCTGLPAASKPLCGDHRCHVGQSELEHHRFDMKPTGDVGRNCPGGLDTGDMTDSQGAICLMSPAEGQARGPIRCDPPVSES